MKRLFLIDGHNLAYRAYYAIRGLSTSKGIPTNAVYGFTIMLLKLLRDEQPSHIAVIFDTPAPTFRHEKYPEYKANRKPMPEDMRPQIDMIKKIIEGLNIPIITIDGYEADDILSTIAIRCKDMVDEVILVTGDKDVLQIVDDKITVQTTKKGISDTVIYHVADVETKFGVPPEYVPDVLGLAGDSIDNIPGVAGIGEKTAISLVRKFGHIEDILTYIEDIPEKTRKKIQAAKDMALLSKELVLLNTEVPIKINLDDYKLQEMDKEKLYDILSELEFKSILQELKLEKKETTIYEIITTDEKLDQLINTLQTQKAIALEIACIKDGISNHRIIGIAVAYEPMTAFYIPMEHQYVGVEKQLKREYVLDKLHKILENPDIRKYGHDIKLAIIALKQYGIHLNGVEFDTMIASYLLNPSAKHNLETIAFNYLGITKGEAFDDTQIKVNNISIDTTGKYVCSNVDIIYRLVNVLTSKLKDNNLISLFQHVEIPLISVLSQMEMNGIKIDTGYISELSIQMAEKIKILEQEIYELCGMKFNINSPKQLGMVLFEKMQLPVIKKTKTGYSTNEDVLKELSIYHPLPQKILEYREVTKLKSTYIDSIAELVNPNTNRIHTSYNQAVTTTGRLSSSNPNLQNIPIRTELGKSIRRAFIPEDGYVLLSADYSQIELRILAHITKDKNMIDAFNHNEDIHARTAARIYDVTPDMVTSEMRRMAKVVNFGIIYGMSAYGLSKELRIQTKKAQKMIDRYFEIHTGVKEYIETTIRKATEDGYVTTLWGRRRYLPELKNSNKNIREFGQRAAINMPIQGTAADIIKMAMVKIADVIDTSQARMLLQVHDELVFEVREDSVDSVTTVVKECMENICNLDIPLKVDISTGMNWGEV